MDDLMGLYPGAHFNNISWPSLYDPAKDVGFLFPPVRPGSYYLSKADDIFQFTFYWSLIFHLPFSFIAGTYAFFNFLFPPARNAESSIALAPPAAGMHASSHSHSHSRSQSQSQSYTQSHPQPHPPLAVDEWLTPLRTNARRSRWTFSLLIFLTFLASSLLRAVLGAAVLAGMLLAVYRASGFYMSTWIPFVWAVIQSLIGLLEIWPSIVDIM